MVRAVQLRLDITYMYTVLLVLKSGQLIANQIYKKVVIVMIRQKNVSRMIKVFSASLRFSYYHAVFLNVVICT